LGFFDHRKEGLISMSRLFLFAFLASLFVCQGKASADPVTFVVTFDGQFGSLDLAGGDVTFIGGTSLFGYVGLGNLADGTLAAIDVLNNLVFIDSTTGDVTTIGNTGIGVFKFASLLTGELFAIDIAHRLYQIDPDTGASTLVGSTDIPTTGRAPSALAGDTTSLYYIYGSGTTGANTLYEIDPTTGQATEIGSTDASYLGGAGFVDGTLYAYRIGSSIFTIDLATGAATDTGVTYPALLHITGSNSGQAP
jgi:hypothetical protein